LKNADFHKLYAHGSAIANKIKLNISPESFNPVLVDFYRRIGFLPVSIVNYLLLLGWSLDDKTEFFTRSEMVRHFTLDRVVKSEASFDPAKLTAFQSHYMQKLPLAEKTACGMEFLSAAGLLKYPSDSAANLEIQTLVKAVVRAAGERIVVGGDILQFDEFFVDDQQLVCDESEFVKHLVKNGDAKIWLAELADQFAAVDDFSPDGLETLIKGYCQAKGIKLGQIIHPLRMAVTGKTTGFGMFETLAILGPARTANRIQLALQRIATTRV
jgi:glutamyl-tRNA synthetase